MYIKYHCSCTSDRDKGTLHTLDWLSPSTRSLRPSEPISQGTSFGQTARDMNVTTHPVSTCARTPGRIQTQVTSRNRSILAIPIQKKKDSRTSVVWQVVPIRNSISARERLVEGHASSSCSDRGPTTGPLSPNRLPSIHSRLSDIQAVPMNTTRCGEVELSPTSF
jgi:hypothetical protein